MIVTIGLCTYQRPTMLAETLESLVRVNLPTETELILIIVDNDSNHSAEPIYDECKDKIPFTSDYIVEDKKGIVYARNRALLGADSHDSDLMLFIDDDEIVDRDWLNAHLTYYDKYDVDVIQGPVYSIYPDNTPTWIKSGKFFDLQQNYQENSILATAATNNVLFDFKKLYHQYGLRFDEKLKSREDNDFFMRARMQGAIIQWTNTAIVHETVPLSKMTASWLLQRTYKTGEAYSKREIKCLGKVKGISMILAKVLYRIIKGTLLLPLSIVYGYAYTVKGLQQFSIAFGMVFGIVGVNYDDYKTIHGE